MKIVTSTTAWNDAIGKRISITYSEVNDEGQIIADNKRLDRVVVDKDIVNHINAIVEYAQIFIDEQGE